ncbi:hypothetical protein ACFO4P_03880 [Epilithonimonas pallida]|uniref:Lipoprotein n=1 Tax=Epilithonimonas pallida TaxID=373671 RepID=A0ABY1R258_9FLAO|nr:hypothetical protein [Epilithonimonas pallida]SMP90748.1 hypothetical protein SAMN05421679_102421 [Epilithonimonas pallida]
MKHIYFIAIFVFAISCSKNNSTVSQENFEKTPAITYDTTAIDSFGPGATSESVMAKINAVAIKREKDSLAAIAKAEQEKLDKEKAEKEAQKIKEEKEKAKTEQTPTENLPPNP